MLKKIQINLVIYCIIFWVAIIFGSDLLFLFLEAHLLAEKNQEIKMLNSIILGLHKKLSAVMETDVSEYEM